MTTHSFDFAVLGGGSAGYAAARTAAALGLNTCVIDGAETLGGLCILRGCMPSKALIESANRQLSIRRAADFGLRAESRGPDLHRVRARKRELIDDFAGYRQGQLQDGRFALLRGHARFVDANALHVSMRDGTDVCVKFSVCCIATGSKVSVPPMPGLADAGFWTSDDVLDADELPASFIVLGGGAIALEMAHYLDGMDRTVTLIQRSDHVLRSMDRECGEAVAAAYRARGITVHCGASVIDVAKTSGGGKRIRFMTQAGELSVEAEQILAATGREPATQSLALENAGVELNGGKVTVNELMQSTVPHIFAAGDVCSQLDVVHIAIQQGETAAKNAAAWLADQSLSARMDYRLKLFGVFSEPQAASVGEGEAALRSAGVPILTASYPFNDHGKSMVMGETEGFVKLIAHSGTGEILGASAVGPEATELIHEIVVAMHFRCTAGQLATVPHYHPTLSEIWTYPAEEIADMIPR